MKLTTLFFSGLFLVACAGPSSQPVVSPTKPVSGPAASAPAPTAASLRLVLSKTTASLGETIQIYLENVGGTAFTQHFWGGTSGCAIASFSFTLREPSGRLLTDDYPGIDRACAAVMVEPSDTVIEPGKKLLVGVLSTKQSFYAVPLSPTASQKNIPAEALRAGRYFIGVHTGLGLLEEEITLR